MDTDVAKIKPCVCG